MATNICPRCGGEHDAEGLACRDDALSPRAGALKGIDLTGRIIGERFRLVEKLGESKAGHLYVAAHVETGFRIMLTIFESAGSHFEQPVGSPRELWNSVRIHHPHVAAVYDVGETGDGLVYAVMEFIDGKPLSRVLEAVGGERFPMRHAVDIALQVAAGLSAAHEVGIVHGDLTPETIMVGHSPEGHEIIKVLDFGMAALARQSEAARRAEPTRDVRYASPERLAGDSPDERSDVFSLGAVLYHLLTGAPPFAGRSSDKAGVVDHFSGPAPHPRRARDDVPEALDQLVAKALAPSPADRFQMVSELQDALASVSATLPADVPRAALAPPPPAPRPQGRNALPPWRALGHPARRRALRLGAGAVALTAALAAVWLLSPARRTPDAPRAPTTASGPTHTAPAAAPSDTSTLWAKSPELSREAATSKTTTVARQPSATTGGTTPRARSGAAQPAGGQRRRERVVGAEARGVIAAADAPGGTRTDTTGARSLARRDAVAAPDSRSTSAPGATPAIDSPPERVPRVAAAPTEPARTPVTRPPEPTADPPVVTARAPNAPAEAQAAIRSAVTAYARAIESRDVAAVRTVHPGLTTGERKAWEDFFASVRDLKAHLTVKRIAISDSVVQASITGTYEYENKARGLTERSPVTFLAVFRWDGTGWRLWEIR